MSRRSVPGVRSCYHGSGCGASDALTVSLDGNVVGNAVSDPSGAFSGSLVVPVATSPGAHLLTVKGSACELNITITVLGALAFTGTSNHTSTVVLAGLAALVLGLVLLIGTRRRQKVEHRTGGSA